MNIDMDDIMLFSSQAVTNLMKECGHINTVEEVKENGKSLLAQTVQYLSQDMVNLTSRKCAVQMHLAVMISQARRLSVKLKEKDCIATVDILNNLYEDFIDHCQVFENFLMQPQNSVEFSSRTPKM